MIHALPNILIYFYLLIKLFLKKNKYKSKDFIISCGRISAPYSLILKHLNKECKIFHILDPYFFRNRFDKILIPSHDSKKFSHCDNVIEFMGTLVSKRKLSNEDLNNFRELDLVKNIITCLIGGDGRSSRFTISETKDFVDQINSINDKYNIVYCFSRRTSGITKEIIRKRKKSKHLCYDYIDKNPYWYLINKSSQFIVTEDSVSMISDATYTGKPVYIIKIQNKKRKIKKFVQSLEKKGVVKFFNGNLINWRYRRINETKRIAYAITKLI